MIRKLFYIFIQFFLTEGDKTMLAIFFSQRVVLGREKFDAVPEPFKADVAQNLIDGGKSELVPAEFGGTMV